MSATWLKLPLTAVALQDLKIGEWVNLSGSLYTARDAALARIDDLLLECQNPPVDLQGELVYFMGPTPTAPGATFGSAGPTTSRRMERFLPGLMQAGVMGIMGKGPLSGGAISELTRHGAVYLAAAGGAGAFYGSKVRGATVACYEELGPEAVYCLHVENFPAVVAVDTKGNDLFSLGPLAYRRD